MSNNFNNENNWRKSIGSKIKSTRSSRAAGKKSPSSQWQSPILWPACSQNWRSVAAIHHGQESSQDCLPQRQRSILCYCSLAGVGKKPHTPEGRLRRREAAFFGLVLGMLGNVPARNRRGRDGPLSHQKLQGRGAGALHALGLSGSGCLHQSCSNQTDFWEMWTRSLLCSGEYPLGAGGDKANTLHLFHKALEHSKQETRIALVITPAPRRMNAVSREKNSLV